MILALAIGALASGLQARTGRDPLPARELERPVVLPRGWWALESEVSWKRANGQWGAAGRALVDDPGLQTTRLANTVRYGVGRDIELGVRMPWQWATWQRQRARGVGDPELWARVGLLRAEPPARSLAVEVGHRAPLALAPLGSGVGVWTMGLVGRVRQGGLRVGGALRAERWTAGRLRSAPESYRGGGPCWIKPGDSWILDARVLYQAGPLWLAAEPVASRRGPLRLGRGPAVFPAEDYLPRVTPGTWTFDLGTRFGAQLTRGVTVSAGSSASIAGAGRTFFPNEVIHPSRGRTWHVGLACRL